MDRMMKRKELLIVIIAFELSEVLYRPAMSINTFWDAKDSNLSSFMREGNFNQSTTLEDAINSSSPHKRKPYQRWHCFDGPVPDPHYLSDCCHKEYQAYYNYWHMGGYYITTILERLQRWNCTEFKDECESPTWPFSQYAKLIYDRFCDRGQLERKCLRVVREVVQRYRFINPRKHEERMTERNWSVLIESIRSPQLRQMDLAEPCIQVALFDRKDGGVGRFHEIVESLFPFCGLQLAGYDYYWAVNRGVSSWTGASLWCQGNIIICIIVMAIFCVATVIANATILGVFHTTEKLRNSQAIYKMSLAVADLLVGVVVWPNMIVMQYLTFFKPRPMGKIVTPPPENSTLNSTSWVAFFPFGNKTLEYREPGDIFENVLPRPFVLFSGWITMLALMVSTYTLMWASFDRFWAVFRPLKYNKHNAQRLAKIFCGVLWAVAFIVSLLPAFIQEIEYKAISSIFVTSSGGVAAHTLVLIALIFPLVVTWIVTISTFQATKRHARARERITTANLARSGELERRLAKTLSLMVGIFTLCVLPALLCVFVWFVLQIDTLSNPRTVSIPNFTAYTTSEFVAFILLTSNSLWNCFIYSLRNNAFREAVGFMYTKMAERSGMKRIGQIVLHIIHSAQTFRMRSLSSTVGAAGTTDVRRKSASSNATGNTNLSESSKSGASGYKACQSKESSSISIDQMTSTNSFSSSFESGARGGKRLSGVERMTGKRKLKGKVEEEYVEEDSTFGSFAVDAGTDRLFYSVMENVPEEVMEEGRYPIEKDEETKEAKL